MNYFSPCDGTCSCCGSRMCCNKLSESRRSTCFLSDLTLGGLVVVVGVVGVDGMDGVSSEVLLAGVMLNTTSSGVVNGVLPPLNDGDGLVSSDMTKSCLLTCRRSMCSEIGFVWISNHNDQRWIALIMWRMFVVFLGYLIGVHFLYTDCTMSLWISLTEG